ncbi:PREDICTED: uncharacterized protein LOC104718125 [Camelina sativa]|uniref:Uncharacterized protein LOC104718125 n=1 Tax=Camelina sativa TaxID=90675 RepID=A0ABM0U0L2_CAMSA|nr:PREDICTED: uncharacterized protein LOC104718125 [Camelina sativa]
MASILVCTTRLSPISYRRLEYVSYHTFKQALAAFEMALQHNPKNTEVSRKIKRLGQLQKDKQRAQELETLRSNVDMAKHLESFKSEMSDTYGTEDCWKEMFSFIVETMETAVKS